MNIQFKGKYKSITDFSWRDVPKFAIITGPNGSGKSQLLDLIYNSCIYNQVANHGSEFIIEEQIRPDQVTIQKGEWQLQNTSSITFTTLQQKQNQLYSSFLSDSYRRTIPAPGGEIKKTYALLELYEKVQQKPNSLSFEEFQKAIPEIIIERESELSQKIGDIFYNYRISEIELLAQKKNDTEIIQTIGERPWKVLRDILKESKLPFNINDPETCGLRSSFKFQLSHTILKEIIEFNDLSSGEKVLISLVFYLYNSQEKKTFPKLLLLDEPDAHLHPSMTQQFLDTIKNVLVDKYGVQVIMTTHSPSTVMLAPDDSIFEMSITEPRIKKSSSKNHAVSLLTSGLVYVSEGTKYFLVEDIADVNFYTYTYKHLVSDFKVNLNIPLVFIPASTTSKSGGKDIVQNWVQKLQGSGLTNIIHGLIDGDSGNITTLGVYKIDRYSIENYLVDPILIYATLVDKEKKIEIEGINISVGEEYKLKLLNDSDLQKISDTIFNMLESKIVTYFPDFDSNEETQRTEIRFSNGSTLQYPKWLLKRRGKTILQELCNEIFKSPIINFTTLFKAFRKLNMIPEDLVEKMKELQSYNENID